MFSPQLAFYNTFWRVLGCMTTYAQIRFDGDQKTNVFLPAAPGLSRRRQRSVSLTTARWGSSWRSVWVSPWSTPLCSTPTWRTCCSLATGAFHSRWSKFFVHSASYSPTALWASWWYFFLLQVTLSYGMFENKMNTIEVKGSFTKEDDPSRSVRHILKLTKKSFKKSPPHSPTLIYSSRACSHVPRFVSGPWQQSQSDKSLDKNPPFIPSASFPWDSD